MKKDIRIAVLSSGWVCVGLWSSSDNVCKLTGAYVIRVWGTKAGIGEIALNGPTDSTVLDKAGIIKYYQSTCILEIECVSSKWDKYI